MAKALKFAMCATSRFATSNTFRLLALQEQAGNALKQYINGGFHASRAHSTLSAALSRSVLHTKGCRCSACSKKHMANFSTEGNGIRVSTLALVEIFFILLFVVDVAKKKKQAIHLRFGAQVYHISVNSSELLH